MVVVLLIFSRDPLLLLKKRMGAIVDLRVARAEDAARVAEAEKEVENGTPRGPAQEKAMEEHEGFRLTFS